MKCYFLWFNLFFSLFALVQSLRITVEDNGAIAHAVNEPVTVHWEHEAHDPRGFDFRFVIDERDVGLAKANIFVDVNDGNSGQVRVIFPRPGRFVIKAVSGPQFTVIGTSNEVTVVLTPRKDEQVPFTPVGPTTTAPHPTSTESPIPSSPPIVQNKTRAGIIAGIIIGVLLLAILTVLAIIIFMRHRRVNEVKQERLSFHPEQMVKQRRSRFLSIPRFIVTRASTIVSPPQPVVDPEVGHITPFPSAAPTPTISTTGSHSDHVTIAAPAPTPVAVHYSPPDLARRPTRPLRVTNGNPFSSPADMSEAGPISARPVSPSMPIFRDPFADSQVSAVPASANIVRSLPEIAEVLHIAPSAPVAGTSPEANAASEPAVPVSATVARSKSKYRPLPAVGPTLPSAPASATLPKNTSLASPMTPAPGSPMVPRVRSKRYRPLPAAGSVPSTPVSAAIPETPSRYRPLPAVGATPPTSATVPRSASVRPLPAVPVVSTISATAVESTSAAPSPMLPAFPLSQSPPLSAQLTALFERPTLSAQLDRTRELPAVPLTRRQRRLQAYAKHVREQLADLRAREDWEESEDEVGHYYKRAVGDLETRLEWLEDQNDSEWAKGLSDVPPVGYARYMTR